MEIKFSTDNASFDTPYFEQEVCRILDDIKDKINDGKSYGSILDLNGNKIGVWRT